MALNKDKLGQILLNKSVVDYQKLDSALKLKKKDSTKERRSLAQILVSDFDADHDQVFSEVAGFYGFKTISIKNEGVTLLFFK